MATAYTSLLGFALPVTGELNGTWGDVVNNSITALVETSIAGSATASVTSADWTPTTTGSGAANQARAAILIPTGTPGVSRNIIVPSSSKAYIVDNQSNAAVVIKGSATTGVSIASNTACLVAWDGADFVLVSQDLSNATGTLAVNKGGTGLTSTPSNGQIDIGNGTGFTRAALTAGTGVSVTNGAGSVTIANTGVTSVTGTAPVVSSGGATPAISMAAATTSVNGYLTSTDWNTFNGKQAAGTYVNSVSATSPVTSSGGVTPTIAIPAATTSVNGYLTSTDWNTFNNKTSNTGTVTSVAATAGTGISITGSPITTSGTFNIVNSAPDQVVSLTQGGTTTITGTYPNFTISSADQYVGTVTSVGGTGTVNGITLTGTVTTSGSLTLGGTLSGVSLTTQVTGTLPVANGGTGAATFTANNVLLGNGTSALQVVAPSTTGNVLTSNGTTWVSSAASGGSAATQTVRGTVFGVTQSASPYVTGIGYQALNTISFAASFATAIGFQAGFTQQGANNATYVGGEAGYSNIGGDNYTAIGYQSLRSTTGQNNTALGSKAGFSGTNNLTSGINNILIGVNAAASAATVSNEITIGNSSNTVVRYPHSYSTVSALPSAVTVGRGSRTFVTDALAPVFQATVAGSGAVFTPVYSDGTNWKVG